MIKHWVRWCWLWWWWWRHRRPWSMLVSHWGFIPSRIESITYCCFCLHRRLFSWDTQINYIRIHIVYREFWSVWVPFCHFGKKQADFNGKFLMPHLDMTIFGGFQQNWHQIAINICVHSMCMVETVPYLYHGTQTINDKRETQMIELHRANKRFIMPRSHKMVKIASGSSASSRRPWIDIIGTVNIFAVHAIAMTGPAQKKNCSTLLTLMAE